MAHRTDPTSTHADARVGVVVSRYNATITDLLLQGALMHLSSPVIVEAPGAYELPVLAGELARSGRVEGVLALGCVIRGETDHDRYINHAVAEGLTSIAVTTGIPIGFGVLTCSTMEQALARASLSGETKGGKGAEAATALLGVIKQIRAIRAGAARPGVRLALDYAPHDKATGGVAGS